MLTGRARTEWLQRRRRGVGGSDAAAILNLSPWASPYSLWVDKTSSATPDDSDMNESMEFGSRVEGLLADWFHDRTGLYLVGAQSELQHPASPHHIATCDGLVAESPHGDPIAVAEMKSTADPPGEWEKEIPIHYQCQAAWLSHVARIPVVKLLVLHLAGGHPKFRIYDHVPDEDDVRLIVETVDRFWHAHVLAGVPPAIDGHPATTDALKGIAADEDELPVDLDADPNVAHALLERQRIKKTLDALATELDGHENAIRAALGSATVGKSEFVKSITWKSQSSTRVDTKALRERLPRVAARFSNTTESRVLRITAHKETA